ncbi:MAG: type II toxin-antitoxin system RelE/ParE family toxin [Planctomycetota bacterium]|nr:type II toxin-antitoxin system RelE/ParE family toxin [Planctomycetota bacterium]MDA1140580.1 type II toxin-antitoxin system RelE/ParE family toxin [Planctomycetota bacterium]
MSYELKILRRAQRELARLSEPVYDRVKQAIQLLREEPRPPGCTKLTGREGWRLRVGNYRVIYEIDDSNHVATVLHVGHRRDVYR